MTARTQDESQVTEWVNTFRHADVVVNLASTVTIDAAIFDRPVVNLDYDPEPGQPRRGLVDDVNHLWAHFRAVAESGGVYLVKNGEEMVQAVKDYLANPGLHKSERRQMAQRVCHCLDGRSGERMGDSILDFLARDKNIVRDSRTSG
jgi:CDP-glycerol glycerophosphotransferase (TagB/SpsB family)